MSLERSGYLRAVAAVMFAAVCAYGAARLFPVLEDYGGTVTALSGTYRETLELYGIALRYERPLSLQGNSRFCAVDGERLASGAAVCQGAAELFTGESSLFLTGCDGFEQLSPPGEEFGVSWLEELLQARPADAAQARLVEGFHWYYGALCTLPEGEPLPALPGRCLLLFEGLDRPLPARLVQSRQEAGQWALLFRLPLGEGAQLSLRKCSCRLLLEEKEGLELPLSALEYRDGKALVYCLDSGVPCAAGVEIIYKDHERCLVSPGEGSPLKEGSLLYAVAGSASRGRDI